MSDQRPRRPTPPGGGDDEPDSDQPAGETPYPPRSDAERRAIAPRDPLRKERAADGGTRSRDEARKGGGARKKKESEEAPK
jgi:hypothetical protein